MLQTKLSSLEMVLIIVVLISLVVIFKDRIQRVLNDILKKIETNAKNI